jgi:hypothetical protein
LEITIENIGFVAAKAAYAVLEAPSRDNVVLAGRRCRDDDFGRPRQHLEPAKDMPEQRPAGNVAKDFSR